jgi:hypothetical protein
MNWVKIIWIGLNPVKFIYSVPHKWRLFLKHTVHVVRKQHTKKTKKQNIPIKSKITTRCGNCEMYTKLEQNNKRACSFVPFWLAWLAHLSYGRYTSTRRLEPEKTQYKMWSTDEPLRKRKDRYRHNNSLYIRCEKNNTTFDQFLTISDNCHIRF